ncbi:MAG: hypothetical protein H7836_01845 [Magnetococcus sp. YQC-3]
MLYHLATKATCELLLLLRRSILWRKSSTAYRFLHHLSFERLSRQKSRPQRRLFSVQKTPTFSTVTIHTLQRYHPKYWTRHPQKPPLLFSVPPHSPKPVNFGLAGPQLF